LPVLQLWASAVTQIDRKQFLGGSDAPVVMGVSPWRTRYQLWLEKIGTHAPEISPERQKLFDRGKRLEPVVLDMLTDEMPHLILSPHARNLRHQDAEYGFLTCEVDAEAYAAHADEISNVEVKTVHPARAADWGTPGSDEIPLHYAAQVMHGLMITQRRQAIVAALIGGDDLRIYSVVRDDDLIASLRGMEVDFWLQNVLEGVAPEPINAADLKIKYPKEYGNQIEGSADVIRLVSELAEMKKSEKALAELIENTETSIKSFMGDAAILMRGPDRIATWKNQERRTFDQREFGVRFPKLLEEFKRASEIRVFRLA